MAGRGLDPAAHLPVSQPHDPAERDADRLAYAALRATPTAPIAPASTTIGSRSTLLANDVRPYFEPRFGRDLGGVRMHVDAGAARATRAIHTESFTIGRDVPFAQSAYAPRSDHGRELIAHELAHVVQQGMAPAIHRKPAADDVEIDRLGTLSGATAQAPVTATESPLAAYEPAYSLRTAPVHATIEHDANAREIASAAHARAVTVGSRIYISPDEFAPNTQRGRELIAHEQVHVAQQALGVASTESALDAAEAEARTLAPILAERGWANVRVSRPAGPLMRDALPEQDLSEDRRAIRAELESRYPWLLRLSNRVAIEREFADRIALERRVVRTRQVLEKLPDPAGTYLSEEIERRKRRRAPVERRLGRDMIERDKHLVSVRIDPMELVSRKMLNDAKTSAGTAAILRELKKYQAWVTLDRNSPDSFRYGLDVRLDGAWLPVSEDGILETAFFRSGFVEPMLDIQRAYYAASAEQLGDIMHQMVLAAPWLAEQELDAIVEEGDAADAEPVRELTPEEQEIEEYQAANKQYAEAVRLKTERAMAPLILIASLFEIDGPIDLLLTIVPVEKIGAKLFKAGRRAVELRRARKLERALIKEFEEHLDDEAREFLKLARGLKKADVRALKVIHEVVGSPKLIEELMRRSVKGTANLEWIAKKLRSKEIDAGFVRSFTRSESRPSWSTLEDIVEKRKVPSETRDSFASKMKGLLGEEAAVKVAKTEGFRAFALGAKSESKITKLVREVGYGGGKSIDLVALTDKAELVVGEVKHWNTSTWISDSGRLLEQLEQHNAGIAAIARRVEGRADAVAKKVLIVSREGFMGVEASERAELIRKIGKKGWTIQFLDDAKIETFDKLIDRLR